jgi:hypothetical protein
MRKSVWDGEDEVVENSGESPEVKTEQSNDNIKSEIIQSKDSIDSRTKRSKFLDAISAGPKDPTPERTDVPNVLNLS